MNTSTAIADSLLRQAYRRACSLLGSGRLTNSAARTDVALFIHRAVCLLTYCTEYASVP